MAKRELIDRNDLYSTTIVTDDFSDNQVLDVVLMEDVKETPVITEQEIVKPYLEKLKEQIVEKSFTEEFFDEDAFNSMYSESVSKDTAECESYIEMTIVKMDDALRLIDNLLSESEDKEYEEEQKKSAEIKIGDEVHAIYDDTPMVVVSIFNEDVTGEKRVVSVSISGIISNLYVDELIRTGRHFPEMAEVLKQMQEGNK